MKNPNLKYGILGGLITIIYLSVFYLIDKSLFFTPLVFWSSFLIYIFFMVKGWKNVGSPEDFRSSLKTMFFVYVVANIVYYIFFYVLLNFIDPGLIDIQRELMIAREVDLEGISLEMTLTKGLFDFCWSCIGGFFLSAIMAFIANRF